MSWPPRMCDRHRIPATIAVSALLVAACVQQEAPGVGIQAVAADVIFGAASSAAAPVAAPPPSLIEVPAPIPSIPPSPSVPPIPSLPPIAGPPPLPPPPPIQECPVASINAFPEKPAERNVPDERRPVEGTYTWKIAGTMRLPEFLNIPVRVSGLPDRSISNVVEVNPTTFTYTTTHEDLAGNTVVRDWQVRTDGTAVNLRDIEGVGDPFVGVPGLEEQNPPVIGEPDRGLSLLGVTYLDPDGNELSSFTANPPLLLAPVPIQVTETFNSVSVDPTTFQTWSFTDAEVLPVERVDACGELVEGYAVQGTLTFVDSEGNQQATAPGGYKIVIAPQLGGILVLEETHLGVEDGPGRDIVETIGQLTPDERLEGAS